MTTDRRTTKRHTGRRRTTAAIGSAALMAGSLSALVIGPASADTIEVANSAPTVSTSTVAAPLTPDEGMGGSTYTIDMTVGDANSLLDLDTVTACLYKSGEGDPNCADANQDARDTVLLTWTRSSDTFTIDATTGGADSSFWALGNGNDSQVAAAQGGDPTVSESDYSPTATAMDMKWVFRLSEVARQGDWNLRIIVDDGDATDEEHDDEFTGDGDGGSDDFVVAHYAGVDTARTAKSWSDVALEGSDVDDDYSAGTFSANGASDIEMSTSTFAAGGVTLENAGGTKNTSVNTNREFAIDVDPDATYDNSAGSVRLSSSAQVVDNGVLSNGTTEDGESVTQSMKLWLGASVPVNTYSGTITVGINED